MVPLDHRSVSAGPPVVAVERGPSAMSATASDQVLLSERIREEMAIWDVPGLSLGILQDGVAETAGFGVASRETGYPVRPDTLFQIGSITKLFTATLVMRLVDEGRLALDVPVVEYLPALRLADAEARERITLRHLLTHTSGLEGDHFNFVGPRYGFGNDAIWREVADFPVLRQMTRPGELWAYCNAGFHLAGAIVARVTGQTYEAAMRERVFEPLGLARTFLFAHEAIVYPVAVGHNQLPGGRPSVARVYPRPRSCHAAGAIISTAGDLLTFAAFHMAGGAVDGRQILSREVVAAMQRPQTAAGNFAEHYGIGWALHTVGGERAIGHGGSTNGFQAQLQVVPSRGFAIAVLTNSNRGSAAARAIVDGVIGERLGLHEEDRPTYPCEAVELASLAGRYRRPRIDVDVTAEGGRLVVVVTSDGPDGSGPVRNPPVHLRPIGPREFMIEDGEAAGGRVDFLDGPPAGRSLIRLGGRLAERVN